MGLAVYQQMKKNHYFLTSTQNVPLAVLLGENGKGLQALQKAETCYQLLAANGFKKDSTYIRSAIFWPCKVKKSPKCLFPLANRYINRSLNLSKNKGLSLSRPCSPHISGRARYQNRFVHH